MAKSRRRQRQPKKPARRFSLPWVWIVAALGVVGIGAFLFVAFLPSSPSSETPASYIPMGPVSVSETDVDLGPVPLDKVVSRTFRVRNESQGLVQLGRAGVAVVEGC